MLKLEDYVISIPDFPEPGIIFRDLTGVLDDADAFHVCPQQLLCLEESHCLIRALGSRKSQRYTVARIDYYLVSSDTGLILKHGIKVCNGYHDLTHPVHEPYLIETSSGYLYPRRWVAA